MLAEVLHLSPRDIDALTVAEFDQACAYVQRQIDEANRQVKQPERSR